MTFIVRRECFAQCWQGERLGLLRRAALWWVLAAAVMLVVSVGGPSRVHSETKLVPSLALSERYDSNVFFAPSSRVPGATIWDFVTATTPQVAVEHKGRLVEGTMSASASGNFYVNNPGLNYISTNAAGNLRMDELIGRLIPGAQLSVADSFSYTPQPISFLTPGPQAGAANPFVIGVQAFRANSYSNAASVSGTYRWLPSADLAAAYSNSFMHFGSSFVSGTQSALLNTKFQTANGGLTYLISARDTAKVLYQYSLATYQAFSFTTHGASVSYSRLLTPFATVTVSGGPTVVNPGNSLNYTGTASLSWRPSQVETLTASYTRAVAPSFFLTASALVSNTVTGAFTHVLSDRASVTASANYAQSEAVPTAVVKFRSYGASASVNYQLTPLISASLAYDYADYKNTSQGQAFGFNRNVVTISLRGTWK